LRKAGAENPIEARKFFRLASQTFPTGLRHPDGQLNPPSPGGGMHADLP
jgi:hypothetical protein